MGARQTKINNKVEEINCSNSERMADNNHASSSNRPLFLMGSQNNEDPSPMVNIPNQPRQPSNLQGLLRYAIESRSENAVSGSSVQVLDEENKRFLSEALSSLTVNVIEELQTSIVILSRVTDLQPHDDASKYESALEKIADYVDSMDIANDFYKIGGFSIFGPCLNSPHSSIRWRAADIIAELSQNNPFCQDKVLETNLFSTLLNMVDSDPSEAARIKALYAVSCIVRGHPKSLEYIDKYDGYSVLLRAIQSPVEKLQIKSAFLLSALCNKDNADELKITLVNMGLIEQVAGLLAMGNLLPETREHLLNILNGLISNNFVPALKECRRTDLHLKATLEQYLEELKPDEQVDELEVCHKLLRIIFSNQETVQDR